MNELQGIRLELFSGGVKDAWQQPDDPAVRRVRSQGKNHWLRATLRYSDQSHADDASGVMRQRGIHLGSLRLMDTRDGYGAVTLAEREYVKTGLSSN